MRHLYLYIALLFFGLLFSEDRLPIRGVIIDISNQKPIPGANIYVIGSDIGTVSNELGAFSLSIETLKKNEIKISRIGFGDTTLFINRNNVKNSYTIFMNPKAVQIKEVTVHSHEESDQKEAPSSILMIGNKLKKNVNTDLATTLTGESGISVRSSGQATQRPILRGYSGDRFLITSDGYELGDLSNTTADHAVSMEISNAEGIEVMRGPETLAYGSNTIAGIINILTSMDNIQKLEIPNSKLLIGHESSNRSNFLGANIQIPLKDYQFSTSLSVRESSNQTSPLGTLKNTALIKNDFSFAFTKFGLKNYTTMQLKDFSTNYGIPGSPEGHINGVDLELKNQTQKLIYHSDINFMSFRLLDIEQGFIKYRHKEFVKGTNYASVDLRQNLIYLSALLTRKNLKIGARYQNRDYLPQGFVWTPNTNESKIALYSIADKNFSNFKLQLSGRLEQCLIKPNAEDSFFSNINASDVKARSFTLLSFGISTLSQLEKYSIYNHILYTSRAPKIEDLFSDGPHLGSYSYEIGDPKLNQENSIGFENTFSYKDEKQEYNLTSYFNYSTNFHILQKLGDGYETGADWIEWGSGSSGWLYKYKLLGLETFIYGFEPNVKLNFNYFKLLANASICRGYDLENDLALSYMPPDLIRFQLEKNILFLNNTFEILIVSSQDRLGEFETHTDSYKLLNYNCSYAFSKRDKIHQLIIQVNNILNETYYNHLSKVKMIIPEPGLGVNINYRLSF